MSDYNAEELAQLAESTVYQSEYEKAIGDQANADARAFEINIVNKEAQEAERRKQRNMTIVAVIIITTISILLIRAFLKSRKR